MPSTCAKFGIQFKNLDNQFVHFSQDQIENFNLNYVNSRQKSQ